MEHKGSVLTFIYCKVTKDSSVSIIPPYCTMIQCLIWVLFDWNTHSINCLSICCINLTGDSIYITYINSMTELSTYWREMVMQIALDVGLLCGTDVRIFVLYEVASIPFFYMGCAIIWALNYVTFKSQSEYMHVYHRFIKGERNARNTLQRNLYSYRIIKDLFGHIMHT
jgi:hypothetical protein